MKTLMLKTRIAAIRARAIEQAADYIVTATDRAYLDRWYTVTNRFDAKRSYAVDMFARTCTCLAFKSEGYCKHFSMAQNDRAEANQIAEYEARERDREEFENDAADNHSRADWQTFAPCHLAGATA